MSSVMDIGPAIVWASALSVLLSLGTTLWNLLSSGARKADVRLDQLEEQIEASERDTAERLGGLERSVQRVADQLQSVPSTETMHRLELSMARLDGQFGRIDERLKPVAAIAERMQELLIERGPGGGRG